MSQTVQAPTRHWADRDQPSYGELMADAERIANEDKQHYYPRLSGVLQAKLDRLLGDYKLLQEHFRKQHLELAQAQAELEPHL